MAILSCSSQWLTEAAFGRTLCICVFWPCICILALFFCSVKPYFIRKKCCIPWWIIIDHSMQHWIGSIECLIANLSSFWWKFLDAEQKWMVMTTSYAPYICTLYIICTPLFFGQLSKWSVRESMCSGMTYSPLSHNEMKLPWLWFRSKCIYRLVSSTGYFPQASQGYDWTRVGEW